MQCNSLKHTTLSCMCVQMALVPAGLQSMSYGTYWNLVRSSLEAFKTSIAKTLSMELASKAKSLNVMPFSVTAASQQGSFCLAAWLLQRRATGVMVNSHKASSFDLRYDLNATLLFSSSSSGQISTRMLAFKALFLISCHTSIPARVKSVKEPKLLQTLHHQADSMPSSVYWL